ncbi:MAG: hypothetical protein N2450_02200 [bacterium]|nr:hypothetical protein [bacterium]
MHIKFFTSLFFISVFTSLGISQTFQPRIEFLMLENPSVFAVAVTIPETKLFQIGPKIKHTEVRRFDIRIRGEALHPFDYHPRGFFTADVGVGLNFGYVLSQPNQISKGTYIGSWVFVPGIESTLDTNRKYHAKNYRFSLGYEQELPFTDFMRVVNNTAQPAKLSAYVSQVRMMPPIDSSAMRADAYLNWSVPIVFGTSWITYGEAHWAKDVRPHALLSSGAEYQLPIQTSQMPGVTIAPRAFARFVTGRRPPTYELINSWEYGITTSISFSIRP